jgi:hypothetical protein
MVNSAAVRCPTCSTIYTDSSPAAEPVDASANATANEASIRDLERSVASQLQTHMATQHGGDRFKCPICAGADTVESEHLASHQHAGRRWNVAE